MKKPRPTSKPTHSGSKSVRLKMRRRKSLHPWIFRGMLQGKMPNYSPGEIVEVLDGSGKFIGRGFFNANSEIAVRILTTRRKDIINEGWVQSTIDRAVSLRHESLALPQTTNAYRIIHSEGDGLSGLVVDLYKDVVVIQVFSAGIKKILSWIRKALKKHFPTTTILVRPDPRSEKHEGVSLGDDSSSPEKPPKFIWVKEGELEFKVNPSGGHKTGFFLDQRNNRAGVADSIRSFHAGNSQGKSNVLDCFCYMGGFGLSAAHAGADSVESIDLDKNALTVAEENRKHNKIDKRITFKNADVFNVLRDYKNTNKNFSHVILDPAKLAAVKPELPKALRMYQDMNRMGMKLVRPGGILVSCSCTGMVSEEDFLEVIRAAATDARAELQILKVTGAPADHPWALRAPEGRYLKAVFSRVHPLP